MDRSTSSRRAQLSLREAQGKSEINVLARCMGQSPRDLGCLARRPVSSIRQDACIYIALWDLVGLRPRLLPRPRGESHAKVKPRQFSLDKGPCLFDKALEFRGRCLGIQVEE